MSERPHVCKTRKVEKLEFHRERFDKSNSRDRTRLALEQERAIHEVLLELVREQDVMVNELRAMRKDMRALMDRLRGGGG